MTTRVAILSVGDELLAGDILDTNAHALANMVRARGHRVVHMSIVGDQVDDIRTSVDEARERAELVLISGGLGPTKDDVTRDGVASALERQLERRSTVVADLEQLARQWDRDLGEESLRQADLPRGAKLLENPHGTAPGFLLREDDVTVACLPGPPGELLPMAQALLAAELPQGALLATRRLRCAGLSESEAGERLADVMDRGLGVLVGMTVSKGLLTVSVRGEDASEIELVLQRARAWLADAVYGEDDETLAEHLVQRLTERGETLATAESCTGGLLAGAITDVPGSSAVFHEGVVAYANETKVARLGVDEVLLARHGAVSEQVARAMAEGLRERSGATWAVSVTGVAGPGGGTPDKPVGLVWFAVSGPPRADGKTTTARKIQSRGSRDITRARAVNVALDLVRRRMNATGG